MAEVILLPRRQAVRKAAIFAMFLLFPVVLNYFSPYVIVDGAGQGIINGSFVVFAGMFVSAVFVGRLWCAWACPAAGLQEACFAANGKPARGGRFDWIKWGIWIPWIGIIAFAAISAGGYRAVNLLHLTESGISVDEPLKYITYYSVVGTIFLLSLIAGRRAFCHYGCWMAPFMVLGTRLKNVFKWPSLQLKVSENTCKQCKTCEANCPMSLEVSRMAQKGSMKNDEGILCGNCVDNCPNKMIEFSFKT